MAFASLRTTASVRRHNLSLLLEIIESQGPISRASLSRVTGLSQPTVGAAIDVLFRSGLVRPVGTGESSGGRPPIMLEFNATHGFIVGIDLGGTNIKVGLTDLRGRVLCRIEEPTPKWQNGSPGAVTDAICAAVQKAVDEAGVSWERVLAIGVGAPGVTDPNTGTVSLAPAVGWDRTPVRTLLTERFRIPVRVDNDVNAAAMAEQAFGHGREYPNFVFVAIGTGIGAGVVINSQLYRGATYAAGELGYMVIDHSWNPADVRDFGCLESMAAAPAITRWAQEVLPGSMSDESVGPREHAGGATDASTMLTGGPEALFKAAEEGYEPAKQAVARIAGYLAAALTNVAVLLDPHAIILGGGISQAGDTLLNPVIERMRQLSPVVPVLRFSALGADAGLLGAAALGISEIKERLLNGE
ncbi:MAG: ROK family transcriptional regulator [Firmicutes bacterium]|jgi:glucokinase|nr:ROK family transcriptional regulator [Bacillota bacterium]MDH7494839.1 ROK family transcriptional regulator [Bacillota bacterium]